MADKKPKGPAGTNSFGRTYEEQTAYEKAQKAKKMKDTNPLADFIGNAFNAPAKAGAKLGKDIRREILKKKAGKIPASPTH